MRGNGDKPSTSYEPQGVIRRLAYADTLLHQRSIEVHRPVLLVDDRWWHLDLGLLCYEISQYLGFDGRPGSIRNALTHQLECPLRDSSCVILVLDNLVEREGHHDRHWMRLKVVMELPLGDKDGV